jgi:hypothetical protein
LIQAFLLEDGKFAGGQEIREVKTCTTMQIGKDVVLAFVWRD